MARRYRAAVKQAMRDISEDKISLDWQESPLVHSYKLQGFGLTQSEAIEVAAICEVCLSYRIFDWRLLPVSLLNNQIDLITSQRRASA